MCLSVLICLQGMTTYEFIMASKEELEGGQAAGEGKGGARAALCRSTRVADEAIMRKVREATAPCQNSSEHGLNPNPQTAYAPCQNCLDHE